MNVLVDTPVWSFALRRQATDLNQAQEQLVNALGELIAEHRVAMLGPVRQEILSGARDELNFERIRRALRGFGDEPLASSDFEEAARASNRCRAAGVANSPVDMLLCAVALQRDMPVFTTDGDFHHYARVLDVELYVPPR